MQIDVVVIAALAVLLPVLLLVVARRRNPEGDAGTVSTPDKTVLHCAAPPPQPRPRRG